MGEKMKHKAVEVTVSLDVWDQRAFREAAYKRAMSDGLSEKEAKSYSSARKTSLGQCAIMLLDPGQSPAGADIIDSSSEER
jgi:hypothetical protein